MFVHQLIHQKAKERADGLEVVDVRIGLGYTLVELSNGSAGLSYSFTKETSPKDCTVMKEAGDLVGKPAGYILDKILSYNLTDSSLALACANAIINKDIKQNDIDIIDLVRGEDKVVMVGYFSPLIEPLKNKAGKFIICERNPRGDALPDFAEYFELFDCDIAILTATSIINKTIDSLLDMIKKARIIAVMGPSTPMDRSVFKNRITHACGSIVKNIELAKRIVSEGGGTKRLKPAIEKRCVY
ncbi:DUF364 domain-containing protein [Hippea maritima]|uniref:Heavy-metal chelation domain-containing protein n=1 Tax=Hippea maritima (strain ATCC 700847 / DSM 10411 / MH2) TaxID=760142 RepID=F2LX44_HIPMA|nr:DUF364 domain-containing protein [Hippea maritima]AEA33102.1 protein of unknown function DUF364 [Hippea maritima DSM 10411]